MLLVHFIFKSAYDHEAYSPFVHFFRCKRFLHVRRQMLETALEPSLIFADILLGGLVTDPDDILISLIINCHFAIDNHSFSSIKENQIPYIITQFTLDFERFGVKKMGSYRESHFFLSYSI